LRIINEEKPQLVFLDVMMPKMNGMEVSKIIVYKSASLEKTGIPFSQMEFYSF